MRLLQQRCFHNTAAVDIQTDLHNYSCNNLGIDGTADAIFAAVHLNSHPMDSAWDQDNVMPPTDIDSNWRSFGRRDYLNLLDMSCNNSTVGLHTDKDALADVSGRS